MKEYAFLKEAKERTPYTNFSPEEYARRYRRIREMMEQERLDCLVVYATGKEMQQKNPRYLSGWADGLHQYVVFPREGEPTLFGAISPHLLCAKLHSHLSDVRWAADDAQGVCDRLSELGCAEGRIGLVGRDQRTFPSLPFDHFERMKKSLPRAQWHFVTPQYERVRAIKSEEEISYYKKGAEVTDRCMQALVDAVKVGAAEYELYAELTAESWRNNAFPIFSLLGSTPMSDPTMPYPWRTPSARRIQKGDIILNELSMSYGSCSGQLMRPIAVGQPTKDYRKLYDLAKEVFEKVAEVLRPGCTKQQVLEAAAIIPEQGYTIEAPVIHGWDDKSEYPHWGIPGRDVSANISREDYPIQENQLIVIEPNPCTKDFRAGMFLGDLGIVRRDGWHSLHKFPMEFVVVD